MLDLSGFINLLKNNPVITVANIVILICVLVIVGVWFFPNSNCSVNTNNLSNSTKVILGALLVIWVTPYIKSLFGYQTNSIHELQ